MRFYFTKNGLPGSKAIMWGLGEDCSHLAIGFDDFVIESRMGEGCGEAPKWEFLKRNKVVHTLTLKDPDPNWEASLLKSVRMNTKGKKYDKGAIAFWAAAALGKKLFGMAQPHKNPWGKKGEHYCVEILRGSEKILDGHLGTDLGKLDLEMLSPYQAYLVLKKSPLLW
jgi:hypothetical protein